MPLRLTPTVKLLLIITTGIWFFAQVVMENLFKIPVMSFFSLVPGSVFLNYEIWRLFTYIFLHSLDLSHILFNMLSLWFVGVELEERWGRKFFLTYYLGSGIGAGLIYVLGIAVSSLWMNSSAGFVIPVVGASGAIFGLMLAYGILFGDRILHFMLLFPMKAKYFVALLAAIQIISMLVAPGDKVAHLAHLGGLIAGYVILVIKARSSRAKKSSVKKTNLRLVVDNEKPKDHPRYWN